MRIKIVFYALAVLFSLSMTACNEEEVTDDEEVDASAFPYSCHFVDTFNKDLLHCVGYKNATSLEEATEWCNDNALGCAIEMAGVAKEGGCESVADVSSGYCIVKDDKCGFTWGTMGDRTPEQDCDKNVTYSSAWGCSTAEGKYICLAAQ